jgi:hypothetical protein
MTRLVPAALRARAMALVALAALAAGCAASTRMLDTWRDPAYGGGPVKNLLVVGVSRSDANRRVFEDGFVRALQAAGSRGSASYPLLPESGEIPNARLHEAVGKAGADAVLVTRVLRVARNVDVRPGYAAPGFYGAGFRGWYGGTWATIPPEVNMYDVLTIESTLWNIGTDKPIWSGTSEVTEPRSVGAATEELAKVLVGKMKADGVL